MGAVGLDGAVMDPRRAVSEGIRWAGAWAEEVGVEWVCGHNLGRQIVEDMGGDCREGAESSGERLAGGKGIAVRGTED